MAKVIRILMLTALVFGGASIAAADHKDCSKDLNQDGVFDEKDTAIIENAMGSRQDVGNYSELADLNLDGFVTISDREWHAHCAR